ncbi:MAG: nuclear transport factor 2 family protein [Ferruginibacter sp.]
MKNFIIVTFVTLFATTCNYVKPTEPETSTTALEEAKTIIARSNIVYWQAFAKNDAALFIDRYAADACIMLPNAPSMCGQNAAAAFFAAAYKLMGIRNGKFTTTEVFGNSEYVTENGLFELRDSANNLIDNGKYLVLWKKTEQSWKMFRDCFSSNNPPMPGKSQY